jgi:Nucleoside-diphosphate-sugar epimerases
MRNSIVENDLEFITNSNNIWRSFEGKNILISGASGFLPGYMVETILYLNETMFNEKANIFAMARNEKNALKRFSNYIGRDELKFITHDVCNPIDINDKIHYIIHAASQASPKFYKKDPVGTLCPNIIGTYNLLEIAREKNVKGFLFFSSGEVYGKVEEDMIPTKEEHYGYIDPLDIRSSYVESKRMGETMCLSWFKQYGVPAKIVRPFHTYGPGMNLNDGRVFADFVYNLLKKEDIVIKSDGKAVRAFCYLADATTGFFTVLLKGENGESYNIGNDKCEISIIELAKKLVNLFPKYKLRVVQEKRQDNDYLESKIVRSCPDISKISSIGWKPHYSIEDGFKRTVKSFEVEAK